MSTKKWAISFLGFFLLSWHSLQAVPAQVIIIRHGDDLSATGIDLDTTGYERAGALSPFFQLDPQVLEFGLPVALFAVKPRTITSSKRALETLTPLSQVLGMPIHTPFLKEDTIDLANLILNESRYDGKMVLICWMGENMQNLTVALGAPMPPPYPLTRFDLIYKITYTDPFNPTFCCGLQELMEGDPTTIPAGFTPCP